MLLPGASVDQEISATESVVFFTTGPLVMRSAWGFIWAQASDVNRKNNTARLARVIFLIVFTLPIKIEPASCCFAGPQQLRRAQAVKMRRWCARGCRSLKNPATWNTQNPIRLIRRFPGATEGFRVGRLGNQASSRVKGNDTV